MQKAQFQFLLFIELEPHQMIAYKELQWQWGQKLSHFYEYTDRQTDTPSKDPLCLRNFFLWGTTTKFLPFSLHEGQKDSRLDDPLVDASKNLSTKAATIECFK